MFKKLFLSRNTYLTAKRCTSRVSNFSEFPQHNELRKLRNKINAKSLTTSSKLYKKNDSKCDSNGKNGDLCKGKENLVAVMHKEGGMKLEEREKPHLCPGNVLIAMDCVGLCATDLNNFMKEKLATPAVLGRDGTGIVAEVGEGVQNLCVGDRVVIQLNTYCGECEFCKNCQKHLCQKSSCCPLEPSDGLLACYRAHPAEFCFKIPDCLTMEEGVLLNMLANGVSVCCRCPSCIGAPVLIVGAGPVGLMSLIALKAMGASKTLCMCKFKQRLEISKRLDTGTLEIQKGSTPEDLAHSVREILGCMPTITIDSVGSDISLKLATAATASGGTIVLTSVTHGEHNIAMHELAHRDITIRSSLKHADKMPVAIALARSGALKLKEMISHHFSFNDVSKAIDMLMENQETANKVVIHITPRDQNNKNPF